jgi:hypothetical protein
MRVDGIKMLSSNFPLSQSDKRDFNVFFTARNGAYMQFLRLRRVQCEWRQATRVIVDEKVVFEKVDKDFPKDQLDWTSNSGTDFTERLRKDQAIRYSTLARPVFREMNDVLFGYWRPSLNFC